MTCTSVDTQIGSTTKVSPNIEQYANENQKKGSDKTSAR